MTAKLVDASGTIVLGMQILKAHYYTILLLYSPFIEFTYCGPYWASPPRARGWRGDLRVPARGFQPPASKKIGGGPGKSSMSGQRRYAHQQEWPEMSFLMPKLALATRRRNQSSPLTHISYMAIHHKMPPSKGPEWDQVAFQVTEW